jgi:hypothetical protein
MTKIAKGPEALTGQLGKALAADTPAWDNIQPQAAEYSRLATELTQLDPPRGTKESWSKLTLAYADSAIALDKAAQAKDLAAVKTAHQHLSNSCNECHRQHRGGPGNFGPGGFGPGGPRSGGFGPGPRPEFGPGTFLAKPVLNALDTDKDKKLSKEELVAGVKQFFKDNDKDNKGALTENNLAEGLNRIFPWPGGSGPPGNEAGREPGDVVDPPQPRPGPFPVGSGPGAMIAGHIMKRTGKDKEGKVTLAELIAAAEALFAESDKDKQGKLKEEDVEAGINLLIPRPPGVGASGGRPEEMQP